MIKNRKLNFKALASKPVKTETAASAVADDFMDDLIGVIGGSGPKSADKKKPMNRKSRSARAKEEEDVFVDMDYSYDMASPEHVSSSPRGDCACCQRRGHC